MSELSPPGESEGEGELPRRGKRSRPGAYGACPKGAPARAQRSGSRGEEAEQGSERSFRRQAETEVSGLCDDECVPVPGDDSAGEAATEKMGTLSLGL